MNDNPQLTTFLQCLPWTMPTMTGSPYTAGGFEVSNKSGTSCSDVDGGVSTTVAGIPKHTSHSSVVNPSYCNEMSNHKEYEEEGEGDHESHQQSAHGQEDSGYNSDEASTTDDPATITGGSMSAESLTNDETCSGESPLDLDELEDLGERIEFLRAKQDILKKASDVVLYPDHEEDLLAVQEASRRARREEQRRQQQHKHPTSCLLGHHSSQQERDEGQDDNDDDFVAVAPPDSIWAKAIQVLETLNNPSSSSNEKNDASNEPSAPKKRRKNNQSPKKPVPQIVSSDNNLLEASSNWKQHPDRPQLCVLGGNRPHQRFKSNPRDPCIPLTGVKRVGSVAFDQGEYSLDHSTSPLSCSPPPAPPPKPRTSLVPAPSSFFGGWKGRHYGRQWMAQALIQTSQPNAIVATPVAAAIHKTITSAKHRRRTSLVDDEEYYLRINGWKVVLSSSYGDPTYPMDLLVPPSNASFLRSNSANNTTQTSTTMTVDIIEATSPQTHLARLVTKATPPFLVVYANCAFLQLMQTQQEQQQEQGQDENEKEKKNDLSMPPPMMPHRTGIGIPKQQQRDMPVILGRPIESLIQVIGGLDNGENHDTREKEGDENQWNRHPLLVHADQAPSTLTAKTSTTTPTEEKAPHNGNETDKNRSAISDRTFESILLDNGTYCQIRIIPVVDRSSSSSRASCLSTTTTSSGDVATTTASRDSLAARSMSHVMIQIEPTGPTSSSSPSQPTYHPTTTTLLRPQPLRIVRRTMPEQRTPSNSSEEDNDQSNDDGDDNPSDSFLFGMVG